MKKISLVALCSFVFLLGASIVSILLKNIEFTKILTPLLIAFGILVVTGIVSLALHYSEHFNKKGSVIIFFFNIIALGLCIRSWHIYRDFDIKLWVLVLVSLACIIYLFVYYYLSFIPLFRKHYKAYMIAMLILSLIGYILLLIFTKTNYVSTFGYYMIVEIGFIFALSAKADDLKQMFKNIVTSTFSVLVVAIIALIIMADGDFDIDVGGIGLMADAPDDKKYKVEI